MTSCTNVHLVSEATKCAGSQTTRKSNIKSGRLRKRENRTRRNGRKNLEGIKWQLVTRKCLV